MTESDYNSRKEGYLSVITSFREDGRDPSGWEKDLEELEQDYLESTVCDMLGLDYDEFSS